MREIEKRIIDRIKRKKAGKLSSRDYIEIIPAKNTGELFTSTGGKSFPLR